ncbi:LysR family transcriptional regulator [Haloactinopolyspora alba]|uniref:LysR family transcriptional regulator n=1 Tax=Haloactinopolyspora alba TaxID=648780 RepID=A0A2P8E171_9ACTN|nr:LysR substrate-binding domain-containing protein [Haloactinopolyspora alba]PSL03189.1 LysR family transcriptional regulator [Haloactinopolyspora alba]
MVVPAVGEGRVEGDGLPRLTPAGAALLPGAQALLSTWRDAQRDLAKTVVDASATVTVGISTGLGRGLLPAVRARFGAAAPRATLQVRQVTWTEPTGGLAGPEPDADAAFVWLPLAAQETIAFESLLDEPFLALPAEAGAARDFWLATDSRGGRPPVIGAEIASTDETREALVAGLGVALMAAGNAPLFRSDDIAIRPVTGVRPSELVLAWRRSDRRPLLRALVEATRTSLSGGR